MIKHGFAKGSAYMFDSNIFTWSLPSGHTCFGAEKCLTFADKQTGALTFGNKNEFWCYSAVVERFPGVRAKYWANYDEVKNKSAIEVSKILNCLPSRAKQVRVHLAGDFFCQEYFDGWMNFADQKQEVKFYAFTKSLPLWINRKNTIPNNFKLIASFGGKYDKLIDEHQLRYAKVVQSKKEADDLDLEIDYNDSVAANGNNSFALIHATHGVRPQAITIKAT